MPDVPPRKPRGSFHFRPAAPNSTSPNADPMPLKRGLERESCDFCYRRKVKCDRLLRNRQGLATCSQCALREEPCCRDDSDDVRIRRRRLMAAEDGVADIPLRESERAAINTPSGDQEEPTISFASASPSQPLQLEAGYAEPSRYPDNLFVDDAFGLSLDSILFLDQVFMGDCGPTEGNGRAPFTLQHGPASTTDAGQAHDQEQYGQANTISGDIFDQFSWPSDSADSTLVTAALHAYFKLAAPYLPILLEDAFWQDYHAHRCSHSLIYAVACRGMPFTAAVNKWDLEQRLARQFREAFLGARSIASDSGKVRLDDLEALALMIEFEYEDAGSLPLHSNLGRLFLTHESLTLMTLQFPIHNRSFTDSDSSRITGKG